MFFSRTNLLQVNGHCSKTHTDHLATFTGAGVGPTIQIGEQTVITVDAKAAGKGKVTCTVCTPDGAEVDVDVVENEDGTFDIFYTAPQPGKYVICVRFGGEHIPNSPFQVTVSNLTQKSKHQSLVKGNSPQESYFLPLKKFVLSSFLNSIGWWKSLKC